MRLLLKKEEAEIVKALRESLRVADHFQEVVAAQQKIITAWQELCRQDAARIEELRTELRLKQAITEWAPVSTSVH